MYFKKMISTGLSRTSFNKYKHIFLFYHKFDCKGGGGGASSWLLYLFWEMCCFVPSDGSKNPEESQYINEANG